MYLKFHASEVICVVPNPKGEEVSGTASLPPNKGRSKAIYAATLYPIYRITLGMLY